jgi:retinol-binding protein 3
MAWPLRITALTALVLGAMPAMAQSTPALDDAALHLAVESIATIVDDEFFDAERAHSIAEALRAELQAGDFDAVTDPVDLASALSERLAREDHHFSVQYIGLEAVAEAMQPAPDQADEPARDPLRGMKRANFGFAEVSILPGNIGYIDMRSFAPIGPARETATAVLNFVANTDAVIFDMRRNHGGAPGMVQFLISHFLAAEPETIINTFVSRDFETPQLMRSIADHPAGHRPDTPLVVLTSRNTGSAGEAFPYHLQALQRATIIGETTAGAGNPGGTYLTDEGYSLFVSTSSARNPVTGTNWEGTGVSPDIEVAADDALDTALLGLYDELIAANADQDEVADLGWTRDTLQATHHPVALTGGQLDHYAGSYGNRIIAVEGDHLTYMREGGSPKALLAIGDDRFSLPGEASYQFRFIRDGDAPASRLVIEIAGGPTLSNSRTR